MTFPISTPEYWSVVDRLGVDTPLQNYARNITTWGDDRQSVVPLRGSDVRIPWVPGESHTLKVPDVRTISIGMWVRGCNDSGVVVGGSARQLFNKNWRQLQRLLWNRGEQFTLTKRFYDETGVLRTASALVEFVSGLKPTILGQGTAARFTVDLKLADPFFYSTAIGIAFDSSVSLGVVNTTILGDWYSRKCSIVATVAAAGVTTPSVACPTMTPSHSFAIGASGTSGQLIQVDSAPQYVRVNGINKAGVVSHTGSNDWLRVNPGACELDFGKSAGNWTGTFTYYPTWL